VYFKKIYFFFIKIFLSNKIIIGFFLIIFFLIIYNYNHIIISKFIFFYQQILLNNENKFYLLISNHINNMEVGRANYLDEKIIINNFYDLLHYYITSLVNYQFQPFPSKQNQIYDTLLFLENIFRFFLLIFAIKNIFEKNLYKQHLFFLIIFFLIIESAFAMGTNNWGAALRHHVTIISLLCFITIFNSKYRDKK